MKRTYSCATRRYKDQITPTKSFVLTSTQRGYVLRVGEKFEKTTSSSFANKGMKLEAQRKILFVKRRINMHHPTYNYLGKNSY